MQVELSHFSGIIYNKVNGQGIHWGRSSSYSFIPILCGLNSSYSFIPNLLKLHWCFEHGLKICMWIRYNPQIICCYLFCKLNLHNISSIIYNKVNGQGIPCGPNSSYSFIPILSKIYWCFSHGLKICMWLRYTPQIICCYFCCKLNLASFRHYL